MFQETLHGTVMAEDSIERRRINAVARRRGKNFLKIKIIKKVLYKLVWHRYLKVDWYCLEQLHVNLTKHVKIATSTARV